MFSWNRLHRGVKALFFVQIVNRMGDFVVPFLTLILTQIQGFSPAVAGLVVTLATALGSLGGLLAGKLSDRSGRRDVLVGFLGTSGLLLVAAGFAPAHWSAAVAMVGAGFFLGGMRPVMGALIADLTEAAHRRAAFSLSYLGINIGVSIGPLLAGWLFQNALAWMFWLDGLSTALALAILVRYVPRRTQGTLSPQSAEKARSKGPLKAFLSHPVLMPFSLLIVAYNFVYSQMIFSLSLQLVELFDRAGPPTFGLVWAINAVTVVALTPLILRWTKKTSNLGSMAAGMGFFALGVAIYLAHPNLVWVMISTLLWSTGEVLFSVHFGDLVTSQSPAELRGRFQGYVGFLGSLGFVVSPVLSGLVAQATGLAGVWWLSTFLVSAVGVGYLVLALRTRENPSD